MEGLIDFIEGYKYPYSFFIGSNLMVERIRSNIQFFQLKNPEEEVKELLTDLWGTDYSVGQWGRLLDTSGQKNVSLDKDAKALKLSFNMPLKIANSLNLNALFEAVDKRVSLANLSTLSLNNCQFTEDTWNSLFSHLKKMNGLRVFNFTAPTIDQEGLKKLLGMIKELNLDFIKLTIANSECPENILEAFKKEMPDQLSVNFKFSHNHYIRSSDQTAIPLGVQSNPVNQAKIVRSLLNETSMGTSKLVNLIAAIPQREVREDVFGEYVQKFGGKLSPPFATKSEGESFLAAFIQALEGKTYEDEELKAKMVSWKKDIIAAIRSPEGTDPEVYREFIQVNEFWSEPAAKEALLRVASAKKQMHITLNTYCADRLEFNKNYVLDLMGFIFPTSDQVEQLEAQTDAQRRCNLNLLCNAFHKNYQGVLSPSKRRLESAQSKSPVAKKLRFVELENNLGDPEVVESRILDALKAASVGTQDLIQMMRAIPTKGSRERVFEKYVEKFGGLLTKPYLTKNKEESFLAALIQLVEGKMSDGELLKQKVAKFKDKAVLFIKYNWLALSNEIGPSADPKACMSSIRDNNFFAQPGATHCLLRCFSADLKKKIFLSFYRAGHMDRVKDPKLDANGFISPIKGQVEQIECLVNCNKEVHWEFLYNESKQCFQGIFPYISKKPKNIAPYSMEKRRSAIYPFFDALYEEQKKDEKRSVTDRKSEFVFHSDKYPKWPDSTSLESWDIFCNWLNAHPTITRLKFENCALSPEIYKRLFIQCDKDKKRFEQLKFIKPLLSRETGLVLQDYFNGNTGLRYFECISPRPFKDAKEKTEAISSIVKGLLGEVNLNEPGKLLSQLSPKYSLEELKLIDCVDYIVCREIADASCSGKFRASALRRLDLSENLLGETDLAYLLKSANKLEEAIFPPSYSMPLLLEACCHPTLEKLTCEMNEPYSEEFFNLIKGAYRKPERPLTVECRLRVRGNLKESFEKFVKELEKRNIFLKGDHIYDDQICRDMDMAFVEEVDEALEGIPLIALLNSPNVRKSCLADYLSEKELKLEKIPASISPKESFFASLLMAVEGVQVSELPEKTHALKEQLKEEILKSTKDLRKDKAKELREAITKTRYLAPNGISRSYKEVEEFVFKIGREGAWGNSIDIPLVLDLLKNRYGREFSIKILDIHAYDAVIARKKTAILTPTYPAEEYGRSQSPKNKITLLRKHDPIRYVPVLSTQIVVEPETNDQSDRVMKDAGGEELIPFDESEFLDWTMGEAGQA